MAELKKSELLEVKNLSVSFFSPQGEICAVRDVSFSLKRGEVLAIVGESGCGKSALCKSVMKLLPEHAKIKSGSILINGADITNYGEREMQRLRGSLFSMVFPVILRSYRIIFQRVFLFVMYRYIGTQLNFN